VKAALLAVAVSPLTYILALALGGAACVIAGVTVLLGPGFGLVAAGAFLIAAAVILTRGVKNV